MTESDNPSPAERAAAVRRAELDRIFGEVLPETTRDERGDGEDERRGDDWYQRNRPPHHEG
ncbi:MULTISPECIES: hypothetical protein [Actinokineospora]|uniref:Uncharacterized protein n=1 Tax=Actinokineospora fastidiosa TaxID=1816 RepID=A0A918L765_9PSEU|nr:MULTISPECIES: hypothetical protein [Actinokineospora]UVS76914.1 hypothetical protein Actkin_00610 [Actinokineospora sp. UTMC 2448]GGS14917.1 hypothetical protein GCM10010171_03550 [Actinokineospora fastidiosa]